MRWNIAFGFPYLLYFLERETAGSGVVRDPVEFPASGRWRARGAGDDQDEDEDEDVGRRRCCVEARSMPCASVIPTVSPYSLDGIERLRSAFG